MAKASRLTAAASGSRHFVMVSSRVTITRLHKESSRDFSSHLSRTSQLNFIFTLQAIKTQNVLFFININKCKQSLTLKAQTRFLNGTAIYRPEVQTHLHLCPWQIQCFLSEELQPQLGKLHPAEGVIV